MTSDRCSGAISYAIPSGCSSLCPSGARTRQCCGWHTSLPAWRWGGSTCSRSGSPAGSSGAEPLWQRPPGSLPRCCCSGSAVCATSGRERFVLRPTGWCGYAAPPACLSLDVTAQRSYSVFSAVVLHGCVRPSVSAEGLNNASWRFACAQARCPHLLSSSPSRGCPS